MDIQLNGGDEVIQPFRITAGNDVADLTGCTVKAIVTLTFGQILEIDVVVDNVAPGPDQPHGSWSMTEEQTLLLAFGRSSRVRLQVQNTEGVTMSTGDTYFYRAG